MFNQTKNEDYAKLFESIYRIRKVEEKIIEVYPTDKIKSPVHLSIGQESVAAGVCLALKSSDVVFCSYRSHATYLAKGGDLNKMIAELYGKESGCAQGKGGSMHLVDVEHGVMGASAVVGTTIANAVGYAYAAKLLGKPIVVVSFFGEGATEEGVFTESLNFAALKKLPILFVCENNGYAINTPTNKRQAVQDIVGRAKILGIEAYTMGNYAEVVYKYSVDVVARIRETKRPCLIECQTYRWREHVGINYDYNLGYRQKNEVDERIRADELVALEQKLSPDLCGKIKYQVDKEIIKAFRLADESPFPEPENLLKGVFKN